MSRKLTDPSCRFGVLMAKDRRTGTRFRRNFLEVGNVGDRVAKVLIFDLEKLFSLC